MLIFNYSENTSCIFVAKPNMFIIILERIQFSIKWYIMIIASQDSVFMGSNWILQ